MKRRLRGKIVSNKMEKTIVVSVEGVRTHPIYLKKYKVSKKFKAHAENAKELEVGSDVVIEETRPISREKRWIVVTEKPKSDKKKEVKSKK